MNLLILPCLYKVVVLLRAGHLIVIFKSNNDLNLYPSTIWSATVFMTKD